MKVLLYLWQLPQNILGLLFVGWYSRYLYYEEERNGIRVIFSGAMKGGISLGKYIIMAEYYLAMTDNGETAIKHELGHCKQSQYLGWFYLPIIGLPSLIWAWLHSSLRCLRSKSYYSFFTESWADRLGGIDR